MELHKILIGLVLSMILMFGFIFFIAEGINKYNPSNIPANYNESFIKITTNMAAITDYSQNASDQSGLTGSESGGSANFDFLGFFFGQGYKAIHVFTGAVGLLDVFSNELVSKVLPGNPMGPVVKIVLITLSLIIIVALLFHFVIKSDRI